MGDHIVEMAVRNNAAWCDVVVRSHGLTTHWDDEAWTCPQRTPTFYPDAVTLTAAADPAALLARVDLTTAGCSIKDSYAAVDLSAEGFTVLFDATWIARPTPEPVDADPDADPGQGDGLHWARVTTPADLAQWEDAWRSGDGPRNLFRDALLDDEGIAVLAGYHHGHVTAGVILYRAAGAVGVSNVFAAAGSEDEPWRAAITHAARRFPGLPMVGYESGNDLAAPERHGFEPVGPLRVWRKATGA